jgi:hypothetical protein
MIDTMLNLLCCCRHRRVTRPMTPFHKPGTQPGDTYVACLECGKQFHYDLEHADRETYGNVCSFLWRYPLPDAILSRIFDRLSCAR